MKVRWGRLLAVGLAIGICLGGAKANAEKYGDVPQSQTFQTSRTKPIYAFDFSEKKKQRIANKGTGTVEALLNGKASVVKDDTMGKCLRGKAGQNNCLTLNENAFAGITEALSVSFWAKAKGKGTIFATESERNSIRIKLDGHLVLEIQSENGKYVLQGNAVEDWTHIAFALNREKIIFYVNGAVALKLDGEDFTDLLSDWDFGQQDNRMAAGVVHMDDIEIYAGMLTNKDVKKKYKKGWAQIRSARATPKPEVTPEPSQEPEEPSVTASPVDMQDGQGAAEYTQNEEMQTPWAIVALISVVIVGIGAWAIFMSRHQKR